jgi:hypothetical protein
MKQVKQDKLQDIKFAVQQFTNQSMKTNGESFTVGYLESVLVHALMETKKAYSDNVLDVLRLELRLIAERK